MYMLDIGLKKTNKSHDPDAANKLSFPLHAVFGFDHDWVNKCFLFYSFHRRNTKSIICS